MIEPEMPYHVVQIVHDTWPQLFRKSMTGKLQADERVLDFLFKKEQEKLKKRDDKLKYDTYSK